ncbi:hypothetical protein BDQ17DRAFT_1427323 [Cyathus striatus]|nr:hypothetical protein BDQ17DRAFT_1427323 [Cyathus striatus]
MTTEQDTNVNVLQELQTLRQALAQLQTRCDNLEHEVQTLRQASQVPVKLPIDIPQEVANVVIDHLHDDLQTLKICSLVSRAWARSARYHLFYTWSITKKNKRSGMNLLVHRLCTFSTFLRRVVHAGVETDRAVLAWSSDNFDINAPPSVHTLVIRNHRVDLRHWGSDADLSRFTTFFQNITELHLCDISCNPLTFITIIMQFPSLVKLKLQNIDMLSDSVGVNDIELWTAMPDSLRVLEIADADNPWVWTFVCKDSTKVLDTFRLKVPSDELIHVVRLGPYFNSAGTSLRTLGLRFSNVQDELNFFQNVDLRENRNVRCLELGGLLQFDGSGFTMGPFLRIHTILSVIQSLLSRHEESDPVETAANKVEEGWGSLDEILAGWQFPLLEKLHFRVQNDHIYNTVIPNHIRSRLPKCSANRAITFTFVEADD